MHVFNQVLAILVCMPELRLQLYHRNVYHARILKLAGVIIISKFSRVIMLS